MNISEIKEIYAENKGFESWLNFTDELNSIQIEKIMDEICILCQIECLKITSVNFEKNLNKDWYDSDKKTHLEIINSKINLII